MKVSRINIYPVKSLSGISKQHSVVESRGLRNDRRYMLIDSDNSLITQREYPKLATVGVEEYENGLRIGLSGSQALDVADRFDVSGLVKVRVWNSYCDAVPADAEINEWFCRLLDKQCRLVKMPRTSKRLVNKIFNSGGDIVSFADGYPVLVIGENSLGRLNELLQKPLPMNRFRPNIVVSGSEAFAEDGWKKIRIGKTVFRATKPCARCVVTTIDQETGLSGNGEPLRTLSKFRKAIDVFPDEYAGLDLNKNDVLFGQNLVPENAGKVIKVGDDVEVVS